ncbi:putative oxidoreductase YrbE [Styela clava]
MGSFAGNRVSLALFGLGRMGLIHFENLQKNPNVRLKYLVDLDQEKANNLKDFHHLDETKVILPQDDHFVFEDPNVDGIIICTPTDTHVHIAMAAIKAGKGVLCEKPLAMTIESTLECYREATKGNIPLLCAFNRRFDPQIRDMYKKRDIIGQVQSIKTCSRDSPRPPMSYIKISGGMFHDCAVHDLDLIRWMIGEEPISVYTAAHAHIPEIAALGDVDTIFIVLKFPSGVIAHIDLSRDCKYGYHQTCEMFGENGNLMSDNPFKSAVHFAGVGGTVNDVIHHSFKQRYSEAYQEEIAHFVALLTGQVDKCCVSPNDTLRATFLAQAAEDSWKSGEVVDLKEHFQKIFKNNSNDPLLW